MGSVLCLLLPSLQSLLPSQSETSLSGGRGGHTTFFGGVCYTGFQKVGSGERIFLEKWGVLGMKIWKICVLRAEILAKTRIENAKFSKIENGGGAGTWAAHWWQIDRLRSTDRPEKGGYDCGTSPYLFV